MSMNRKTPVVSREWTARNCGAEKLRRERNIRLEEQTREGVARELNDTVLQGFIGASTQLHSAVDDLAADSTAKPPLNRALGLMQRVIDEARDVVRGLRSTTLPGSTLEEALSSVREEFDPDSSVRVRIFVKGQREELLPEIQEQVYRISREALINALRHSRATTIEAELEYSPRRLRVVIRDNGCGIDPRQVEAGSAPHWGLAGMRERAESIGARLRLWSRPGGGTEMELGVPVAIAAAAYA